MKIIRDFPKSNLRNILNIFSLVYNFPKKVASLIMTVDSRRSQFVNGPFLNMFHLIVCWYTLSHNSQARYSSRF